MKVDFSNLIEKVKEQIPIYAGNSRIEPTTRETGNLGGIIVYGKKPKYNYLKEWPGRTHPTTASDAAEAWDTMVTPALSWLTPNFFRAVDSAQKGDIDGVALEGLKTLGLKGAGTLASNTTKAGLSSGLNTVRTAVTNPVATTKAVGTAISNVAKNVVTPGSSFWTNPLTRQFATGLGLHSGANAAIRATSPYESFGDVVGSAVEQTTGWNPNSTATGQFLTESLDPSWYVNPTRVTNTIGKIVDFPFKKSKTLRRWKRQYNRTNSYDPLKEWRDTVSYFASKYDRMASKAYNQTLKARHSNNNIRFKGPINLNKASDENILKYLKKYYPEGEFYIENGNIYLKNRTIKDQPKQFLDYSTGQLRDFNFGVEDNGSIEFPRTNGYSLIGRIFNSDDLQVSYPSQEFINLINNNTRILQEKIPGFIPFGSSQGVSKMKLPYTPHDIDGYITKRDLDVFLKNNPDVKIINKNGNETITVDLFGKGEPGYVDLNIIDVDKVGHIGNERTEELFRQFFPQAYRQQIEKLSNEQGRRSGISAINTNGVVLTFDDFVNQNYLTKTIMDSMEADFTNKIKNKHIDRIFRYLISPNQNEVSNALSQTTNMLFQGTGRQLPKLKFGTVDENIQLLTKIGYPKGYAKIIAQDTQKMQNALDYWYLSNRSAMRASNAGTGNSVNSQFGTPETLNRNFSKWDPEVSQGGTASGGGINTTIEGPSGHIRHFIGYAQPRVEGLYDGMQAEEAVKLIDNKLGLNTQIIHTSDPISYSRELQNSGIRGMIGGSYGRGKYYGMGDLDLSSDGLGIFRGDVIPEWKDFKFPGLSERNTPSTGTNNVLNLWQSSHSYPNHEGVSELITNLGLRLHMKSFKLKQILEQSRNESSKYYRLYYKNRRRVNRKIKFGKMSGIIGSAISPLVLGYINYNSDDRLLRSMDFLEKHGIIARDSLGYIDMYKEDYNKLFPDQKELVDKYMKMINQHEFKHNNSLKIMREAYKRQVLSSNKQGRNHLK